ncbi:MAG: phenylacetate--CoA ligase [Firmicutes bacterium]|nr:phenylacetate--CoA ligase [Bacillota bacterium]
MYWQKKLETMDAEELRALQLKQLNLSIARAKNAPFYRSRGLREVKSLEELQEIPFTTKQDLRDGFPYGFLAVGLNEVVRLHSSSGTTGNPTVVFHTATDIDQWANLVARCMYMTGVRPGDVFQNTMGYGLFTGGLGFHYGAEKLGVLTIPIGPGNSKRQIWFMQKFGTTVVHILPSYAMHLYSIVEELGIDPKADLKLRIAFIGSEPHSDEMRRQIERLWGVKAYNSYGLSEVCGPGVAFECPEQNGMHIWEDSFIVEIVDPATGRVLPDGEEGELVLTTLQREAMPLLRYRTGDLTRILPGRCPCGRTHRRIERIKGRTDDMLIVNGVNIFPIQIERTIMRVPGVGKNYLIEIHEERHMDRLHVKVEVDREVFHGTLAELTGLKERLTEELKTELTVTPVVSICEPGSLPVSEGKAKRVVDLRTKNK